MQRAFPLSLSLAGAESGVVFGRPLGAGAQGEEDAREEAPRNGGGTQGEKERMLLTCKGIEQEIVL